MSEKKTWKTKEVKKEEVIDALEKSEVLINRRLLEGDSCLAVDYLSAHKANREFKVRNGLRNKDVLKLVLDICKDEDTLYRFCHKEIDRLDEHNMMYCFKLTLLLSENRPEEVLFKFKFRQSSTGEQVFIMSFHYPDPNLEPWEVLWYKN